MLIGDYYREKVMALHRKERKKFEIPLHSGVTRIENEFFGWKLYYLIHGRKSEDFIECRTEEEARYLKIFMELEAREIYIPKDENLIAEILPRLEYLKKQTDDLLNEYLSALMQRKHREQLRFMVYKEIMGEND